MGDGSRAEDRQRMRGRTAGSAGAGPVPRHLGGAGAVYKNYPHFTEEKIEAQRLNNLLQGHTARMGDNQHLDTPGVSFTILFLCYQPQHVWSKNFHQLPEAAHHQDVPRCSQWEGVGAVLPGAGTPCGAGGTRCSPAEGHGPRVTSLVGPAAPSQPRRGARPQGYLS